MRKLIINADDFGWNKANDKVIMEMFINKTISSSSVMVNGSNIMEVKQFFSQNRNISIGLHLNLTEGQSLKKQKYSNHNDHSSIFTLIDNKGDMLGKLGFREAIKDNKINICELEDQIRLQINKFIEIFGQFPVQIDGHQHVHIIPLVAQSLARIMTQEYGVYKTRLIQEKLIYPLNYTANQISFYQEVIDQSKISEKIYSQHKVFACNHFIGINLMGQNLTLQKLEDNLTTEESLPSSYTEWMCHPGQENELDLREQFYNSIDREYEANIINLPKLKQILQANHYQIISFKELKRPIQSQTVKKNILIYSQMIMGTGNFTTCLRIQSLLEETQFNVFLRNINSFSLDNEESCIIEIDVQISIIQQIRQFCSEENITFILGINMYRTGIILDRAFGEISEYKIPYILIISGTDANIYMKDKNYKESILKAIKSSYCIISLNQEMIDIVQTELSENSIKKNIILIPQSVSDEEEEIFSFKKLFDIPLDNKLIVLPASFREVKDIEFILQPISRLFQGQFQDCTLVIVGPILDQGYFNKINTQVQQINEVLKKKRVILCESIKHSQYIYSLRREFQLLINCSLNEGLSSALLEAMKYKVPVLARGNKGNKSLITHLHDGLIFDTQEEFYQAFTSLMTQACQVEILTTNAKLSYESNYSQFQEQTKLIEIINQAISSQINHGDQ